MDVHDGGAGSPKGPNTSREAETPPARDTVPRPRAELPSPEPASRAGQADSEPVPRAGHADSDGAVRAEAADPAGDPVGRPVGEAVGGPAPAPVSELVGEPEGEPAAGPVRGPRRPEPRTGVAALSTRYQVGAALALAVVAVTVCVHVGMVFLHVAPSNTVTKAHGKAIDEWIYPEFEQNWKLFAPNPLQQNVAVHVRAQIRTADGGSRTTGWYDLSAQDGRAIDGNLLPSHTQQNELRRAWDFFTATHDNGNRPVGLRGALSETYLRHIVVQRLERGGAAGDGGVVERIQIRSQTTNVTPPKWSTEKVSMSPVYRELSWWSVPDGETEGGTR
ncbi:DUF5819 family protein [Streptomyces sp. Root1310]|uniref:DUF5819 family protein n=1 Tax=Streptomyces sp. Root1310 TaxID=1736452 RepID=UPI00070B427E|nr:DUF5819 family protein [Streptomyces sp. Root1310]KQX62354.1 hypothetical protein ASD48_27460 [Streptomyces sp. Root1310]